MSQKLAGNSSLLQAGYAAIGLRLQEASATDLSNSDIDRRVADAVRAAHQGTGDWAYYVDRFGDEQSGDVIFSTNSQTFRAPYSISTGGDGETAHMYAVDLDEKECVYPRTVYEAMPDEDDHYAQMAESYRESNLYNDLPLYERFIAKTERDAATDADFAGKGKSYPLLKPADIPAAAHALGRAGSDNLGTDAIKKNIISIAKRKGWTKYLPKAWQVKSTATPAPATAAKEAVADEFVHHADRHLKLTESAVTLELIEVKEGAASARSEYAIKLIAPGRGTTAYYTPEVLKRDGPKVFTEGTKVFLNHQTESEEKSRPEGDVNNLAGVLTTKAEYQEAGPKGPGLYARMKVFADHAQTVAEKAVHVGMSIRAYGSQLIEGGKKMVREGVPVIGSFKASKSVDIVAQAGAGGLILTESKKPMAAGKSDCADCKGTGDCTKCKGTGKMLSESSAKSTTQCTDCEGSGECPTCEGDGMVKESAPRTAAASHTQETEMDETTVQKLIESAVGPLKADLESTKNKLQVAEAANTTLLDRAFKGDAKTVAQEVLDPLPLRKSAKEYVLTESLKNLPMKDGALDVVAFKESVTARAKDIAAIVGSEGASVHHMGTAPVLETKESVAASEAEMKSLRESGTNIFSRLMQGDEKAAAAAANKGVAA